MTLFIFGINALKNEMPQKLQKVPKSAVNKGKSPVYRQTEDFVKIEYT